jgi:hypothetical protein
MADLTPIEQLGRDFLFRAVDGALGRYDALLAQLQDGDVPARETVEANRAALAPILHTFGRDRHVTKKQWDAYLAEQNAPCSHPGASSSSGKPGDWRCSTCGKEVTAVNDRWVEVSQ